jgi:hypothetical protein
MAHNHLMLLDLFLPAQQVADRLRNRPTIPTLSVPPSPTPCLGPETVC